MRYFVGVLGFGVLTVSPVWACDSTSCALVTRGQNGVFNKRGGSVDLSFRYVDTGAALSGSRKVDTVTRPKVDLENGVIRPAYHREESGYEAFVQVDVVYGISDRVTLAGTIPFINHRSFTHLHAPAAVDDEHGHGGGLAGFSFTSQGFGDVWAGVRYAILTAPDHALVGGFSIKAPTGSNEHIGGFDHTIQDPMLQPGTGSWDFLGSLAYTTGAGRTGGVVNLSYLLPTANEFEYRFGPEAIAAVGARRQLAKSLTGTLQIKGHYRGRSDFGGEPVPSTGESSLHAVPGLRFDTPDRASLYLFFQVPLYRRVNEEQLSARVSVMAGFSKSF
jgi:hypothetical protein